MKFLKTGHEIKYFAIRRVATGVIILGCLYDQVDNAREASAATTALRHGMIDFGWDNQLPTILVKELVYDLPDFHIGDVVTAADQHVSFSPSNMTFTYLFI
jgi:hypothetical protein